MKHTKNRTNRKWIIASLAVGAIALGVWSRAQSANAKNPNLNPVQQAFPNLGDEPPMTPERELARLAVLDPVGFEKLARRVKTQQELQAEEIARFAITQPKAYATEFERFKTPERKLLEQQARAAILNPVAHSGPPKKGKTQRAAQNPKSSPNSP